MLITLVPHDSENPWSGRYDVWINGHCYRSGATLAEAYAVIDEEAERLRPPELSASGPSR